MTIVLKNCGRDGLTSAIYKGRRLTDVRFVLSLTVSLHFVIINWNEVGRPLAMDCEMINLRYGHPSQITIDGLERLCVLCRYSNTERSVLCADLVWFLVTRGMSVRHVTHGSWRKL